MLSVRFSISNVTVQRSQASRIGTFNSTTVIRLSALGGGGASFVADDPTCQLTSLTWTVSGPDILTVPLFLSFDPRVQQGLASSMFEVAIIDVANGALDPAAPSTVYVTVLPVPVAIVAFSMGGVVDTPVRWASVCVCNV